jgi:hypothetical protein
MELQIIKLKRNFALSTTIIFLMWGFTSCYYDNEKDLYPTPPSCDTVNITYSGTVAPIMATNCNACHGTANPSGGVITDNYNDLKTIVDNGSLRGAINHLPNYSPMPQGGNKLNDCDLTKIGIWIDNGAPNN